MRTQDNTIDTCLKATEMVAYLKEELDEKSTSLVDQHLADCELCCDALEGLSVGSQDGLGLEDMESSMSSFQEQANSEDNNAVTETAPIKKLGTWYAWRVAAAVLLFASIFWFWKQTQTPLDKALFAQYYTPYEDLISTRSEEEPLEMRMKVGMGFYNASQFEQAVLVFEDLLENGEESDLLKTYLGISYLSLTLEEQANAQFKAVIENRGALTDVAQWYLGLSLLKQGEEAAAKDCLAKVVEQQGVFQKEAQEILEELN